MIFKGNLISDSDKYQRFPETPGALAVSTATELTDYASFDVLTGFLIEENTIENCPWSGIYVRRGSGVVIRNNTLRNTNLASNPSISGAMVIEQSRNLFLNDNIITRSPEIRTYATGIQILR